MSKTVSRSVWGKIAALSGASGIGVCAYGAHGFRPADPQFKEVYKRGSEYHLLHSFLIALAPLTRRPNLVGGLATTGVVLFSGSCYATAWKEDRKYSALAPYGGFSLIGAWLAIAL